MARTLIFHPPTHRLSLSQHSLRPAGSTWNYGNGGAICLSTYRGTCAPRWSPVSKAPNRLRKYPWPAAWPLTHGFVFRRRDPNSLPH